jgi:hypothetical protein
MEDEEGTKMDGAYNCLPDEIPYIYIPGTGVAHIFWYDPGKPPADKPPNKEDIFYTTTSIIAWKLRPDSSEPIPILLNGTNVDSTTFLLLVVEDQDKFEELGNQTFLTMDHVWSFALEQADKFRCNRIFSERKKSATSPPAGV